MAHQLLLPTFLKKGMEWIAMDVREYKDAVIDLFKNGKPTDAQWQEMAASVLDTSELSGTPEIDGVIIMEDL